MKRIRMLEAAAGDDFSWAPGDVVELPDDQAAAWADGYRAQWAEPADGDVGGATELPPVVQVRGGVVLPVVSAVVEIVHEDGDGEDCDGVIEPGTTSRLRWSVTVDLPDDLAEALGLRPSTAPSTAPSASLVPAEPSVATTAAEPVQAPTAPEASDQPVFDPDEHSIADVLAYLAGVGTREAVRVLDAEASGQARKGIAKVREDVLAQARANDPDDDPDGEQAGEADADGGHDGAEKAAETSRGGGRGDGAPETR